MALLGFDEPKTKILYQNCGDRLNNIYEEVEYVHFWASPWGGVSSIKIINNVIN